MFFSFNPSSICKQPVVMFYKRCVICAHRMYSLKREVEMKCFCVISKNAGNSCWQLRSWFKILISSICGCHQQEQISLQSITNYKLSFKANPHHSFPQNLKLGTWNSKLNVFVNVAWAHENEIFMSFCPIRIWSVWVSCLFLGLRLVNDKSSLLSLVETHVSLR